MFTRRCGGLVVAVLAVLLAAVAGRMPQGRGQTPKEVEDLMLRKLVSAQSLLKGLAVEDFDLITQEAQRLNLLSQDVSWNILQTEDYRRISVEFRKATEQLQQAGEKKNLEAAGLGYIKLTMTCIDCHRHMRDQRK